MIIEYGVMQTNSLLNLTNTDKYWLGFLAADGYFTKYYISLCLSTKDRKHIEAFRFRYSDINKKITDNKNNTSSFKLCGKELLSRLTELGFHQNKTYTIEAHDKLKDSRHFWRGVKDGDGCITVKRGKYPTISLVSASEVLINQFKEFVSEETGTELKVKKYSSIYSIEKSGKRAKPMANLLYKKDDFALGRKKKKCMELFN